MPYPDRCASRAVVARGCCCCCALLAWLLAWLLFLFLLWLQLLQLCSGCCAITVPSTSCCASQGAVVAVAAVAAASASCPAKGQYLSRNSKKFGRAGHKHNHRQHLPTGLTFGGVSHSRKFNGKNRPQTNFVNPQTMCYNPHKEK